MSTTPPPTTPAGTPPPPAQTAAAPEAATIQSVVDALKPVTDAQAASINTWQTRLLVERLLNEKRSRGPLQGVDITVESLFKMATDGWDNPAVKSGTLLRTACAIMGINPVPAAPQPPAVQQSAVAPTTWGDFPAALPGAAETTHATTDTKKAARKAAKRARKALKRARQRALLIGITSLIAGIAGVAAGVASGWAAFIAAAIAVVSGIAGLITGIKTYGDGHSRPQR